MIQLHHSDSTLVRCTFTGKKSAAIIIHVTMLLSTGELNTDHESNVPKQTGPLLDNLDFPPK